MSERATEFVWRKWDGTPHWHYAMTFLGSDEHGDWFGQLAGAEESRPGAVMVMPANRVALVPKVKGWVATFHAAPYLDGILTYIDIASQVMRGRRAGVVNAIDTDLDVIKSDNERAVWIEDEDELEERTISMSYPQAEVGAATRAAADLLVAVRSSAPPFNGKHEEWLSVLHNVIGTEGQGPPNL